MTLDELLEHGARVVTIGARGFADALRAQDADVIEVDWTPPPTLEPEIADLLEKLR